MKKNKKGVSLIMGSEIFYRELQEDGGILFIPFGDGIAHLIKQEKYQAMIIAQKDAFMKAIDSIKEIDDECVVKERAIDQVKKLLRKLSK